MCFEDPGANPDLRCASFANECRRESLDAPGICWFFLNWHEIRNDLHVAIVDTKKWEETVTWNLGNL